MLTTSGTGATAQTQQGAGVANTPALAGQATQQGTGAATPPGLGGTTPLSSHEAFKLTLTGSNSAAQQCAGTVATNPAAQLAPSTGTAGQVGSTQGQAGLAKGQGAAAAGQTQTGTAQGQAGVAQGTGQTQTSTAQGQGAAAAGQAQAQGTAASQVPQAGSVATGQTQAGAGTYLLPLHITANNIIDPLQRLVTAPPAPQAQPGQAQLLLKAAEKDSLHRVRRIRRLRTARRRIKCVVVSPQGDKGEPGEKVLWRAEMARG